VRGNVLPRAERLIEAFTGVVMRISTLPLLLFILLGFAYEPTSGNKVDLGKEFNIKNGQEAVVRGEKLRIAFRSVHDDSRCPNGVTCVWAGNGQIVIEVAKKNKKQVVAMLNTSLEPKEIAYMGFTIKLVGLSPYPKVNEAIDPKDYEATMVVTKD
jgi:hypothetical protein